MYQLFYLFRQIKKTEVSEDFDTAQFIMASLSRSLSVLVFLVLLRETTPFSESIYLKRGGGRGGVTVSHHGSSINEGLTRCWSDSADDLDLSAVTPLYTASAEGRDDVVAGLLDMMEGCLNELSTVARRSALWIASNNGHGDVVGILIAEEGCDIELADTHGSTPLLAAAEEGHADIVQLLLKAGARTDVADGDGDTPIQLATLGGHTAVVELLKEHSPPS